MSNAKPVKELPWRTELRRKDILAGVKPHQLWYNRWFRFLCHFNHKWGEQYTVTRQGHSELHKICDRCGMLDITLPTLEIVESD